VFFVFFTYVCFLYVVFQRRHLSYHSIKNIIMHVRSPTSSCVKFSLRECSYFRMNLCINARALKRAQISPRPLHYCPVVTEYNFISYKKYVLSNSESVQCNFFIFDQVTFIQFKVWCCVQNFIEIGWCFADIWRYINFQNGGRPPSWNCFTTIRYHLHVRSLCWWPQLPVKFYVNLIHRSEDIAWLEMPIQAPKWGFWGTLDP